MDHIYPAKDYKLYKIKDEVEKLQKAVRNSNIPKQFSEISTFAGISDSESKRISLDLCASFEDYGNEKSCGFDQLAPSPFSLFPEEALKLNCVNTLREGNFDFKKSRARDRLEPEEPKRSSTVDLKAFENSVITIRFYEPFKYTPSMKNQPRFHQEYLVLGSNLLTDLRDKFYCQCNQGPFFDISEMPRDFPTPDPNRPNPGFFFIHDTFFNDTRNPDNPDYSNTITSWLKRFDYIRDFKTASLQDTKFEDLVIRFGYPCLYQHHGNCEHIFCITSVDLLDFSNSLSSSDYPILKSSSRKRSTLCDICGQADASFLVTNCALHVKDPLKVCENCYLSFHYEKDGITKTCNFNAYKLHSQRPEKLE